MSKKSTSSGSINQLATDSWNQLQYQLLASQSRGKSIWTATLLYEYSFNKSCCPVGFRFWHATLKRQWAHRFPLACLHSGTNINKFYLLQHTFFYILFFSNTGYVIQILSTILNVVLLHKIVNAGYFLQWSEILPVMHNLQKYCKWTLFGKHNTFLAHTIHLMLMTCDMIDSPFQSADKRRTRCAGSPNKASTSFWHLGPQFKALSLESDNER